MMHGPINIMFITFIIISQETYVQFTLFLFYLKFLRLLSRQLRKLRYAPKERKFVIMYLKQNTFLGYVMLQLFCICKFYLLLRYVPCSMSCTFILALYVVIIVLLLLLLSSSSSSSSPLCRVFILTFLRQSIALGNTVLQLFCCYYSWCLYR